MKVELYNQEYWSGRIDEEDGALGIRIHQIIKSYIATSTQSKVFVGFCSEEGVKRNKGRLGAQAAPNYIRKALANLPVHFADHKILDYGNIVVNDDLELGRAKQIEVIDNLLNQNNFPIIIGGGHETALGSYLSFIKKFPKKSIIINLDAHFDIRLPGEQSTSGTPFYEMYLYAKENKIPFHYLAIGIQELGNTAALFERATHLNVNYILADEIHSNFNQILERLKEILTLFDHVYLSLDMDVFDVAYAPGVSATTINGLTPFQIKYLLKFLFQSNKVKVFDLVEVNPSFDIDNRTSKLAAQMIYEGLR